ncbi:MAG: S41 family peptidase [Fimbriimonadaceae bacterium]
MMTSAIAFSMMYSAVLGQPRMSTTIPYMRESADESVHVDERSVALLELFKQMAENYVVPAISEKIETDLTKWMKSADFASMTDPAAFTAKVNEVIKANVTDAHLRFRYSPRVLPVREAPGEPSAAELKDEADWIRRVNSNFRAVERLEGNIGYFAVDGFQGQDDVRRPMASVMSFLANTDALIIDLRENGGGDPAGVQLVCSYFFGEKPVHLNSLYFREGNHTEEFWTLKELDAPRYVNKPIYVLVSKRTGSGAEECAYNLQQLHRATIIGEPTWGGANPGGMFRLSDHYSCFIPVGRAINPYTKTNWEGTGVIPDVKSDPAKAKETAQLMLLKDIAAKETDSNYKKALEGLIQRLESTTGR